MGVTEDERAAWAGRTQIATQILDEQVKTGPEARELGRKVSESLHELFVVCQPSEALRQHLELGVAPFVVLHDLGSGHSLQFLEALSKQTRWPLRRLCVRRQGFGDTLATLHFLDCPTESGSLRIYASRIEAEAGECVAIRRQLLTHAGANVLLAEQLPGQTSSLGATCLKEDLMAPHKPGGMALLVLPQSRDPALRQDIDILEHGAGLRIEVAPATQSVPAAWALMATYLNRQAQRHATGSWPQIKQVRVGPTTAPAASPSPTPVSAGSGAVSLQPLDIDNYVLRAVSETGATSACVFNLATRQVEAQSVGAHGEQMAQQGFALLGSVGRLGDGLGLGRAVREVCVTLGDTQVLVRPARIRNGCVLMLMLPRSVEASVWRTALDQLDRQAVAVRTARRG